MIRAALLSVALFVAAPASAAEPAAPATSTTSGAMTTTTASDMKPGVPKVKGPTHPFFFAAYGLVWVAVLGYVLVLALRVKALEERIR